MKKKKNKNNIILESWFDVLGFQFVSFGTRTLRFRDTTKKNLMLSIKK